MIVTVRTARAPSLLPAHRTGKTRIPEGLQQNSPPHHLYFRSHQRKITLTSRDDYPALNGLQVKSKPMQTNLMQPEPSQLLHMNLNCKLEMFYNQKQQQASYNSSQESRRDPWSDCLTLIPDFPADTFSDISQSTSEHEDFLCDLSLNSSLESLPLDSFNFFNEKQNIAY